MDEAARITEFLRDLVGEVFEIDEPLLMTHKIDSMDVVETASWMEKEFGITIVGEDITFDTFDSIGKMGAFVRGKLGQQ